MNFSEDKENEFQRRETELNKKERELKLRELELEINQSTPPLYETKKHQTDESKFANFSKKLVRYGKFIGFVVVGIALAKVGLMIGVWLTNLIILAILGLIGYKLFIEGKD